MGDSQIRIKMATVLVLNDVIDCSCFATNTKNNVDVISGLFKRVLIGEGKSRMTFSTS